MIYAYYIVKSFHEIHLCLYIIMHIKILQTNDIVIILRIFNLSNYNLSFICTILSTYFSTQFYLRLFSVIENYR